MTKLSIGFLVVTAAITSLFFTGSPKQQSSKALNAAVIAFRETYYAPVVTSPDILPSNYDKIIKPKSSEALTSVIPEPKPTPELTRPQPKTTTSAVPPPPRVIPSPSVPLTAAIVTPAPTLPTAENSYLANPEPVLSWLRSDIVFSGDGFEETREFNPITIDREYWKIDVWSYWISPNPTFKSPVEADYFKLEIYKTGESKPVYSIASGKEENFHINQSFKKPGKYYFKTYTKPVSKYEINLYVSPTLAK